MTMARGMYVAVGVLCLGVAQSVATRDAHAQGQAVPKISMVPCTAIASVEGKDNFASYCATCHGVDGKGQGPATPALKGPVPDLTTIASRHSGKFDQIAVERLITGADKAPPVHGSVTMPMWGPVFRCADTDAARVTLRLRQLVKYLQSIQAS
jgi:mono/diheme cytochrome c family protein